MTEESQASLQKTDPPRFQFVRQLGRGVLGEAYEVLDEVRGEPVVLKVFLRSRPRHPDRFKLEFESLARLEHPALVKFHHLVDPASDTNVAIESRLGTKGLAFTQEYIDGVDLMTWLRRPPTDDDLSTLETRRTPTTGEIPLPEHTDEVELEEESETSHLSTGAIEVSTDELAEEFEGEDTASSIVEALAADSDLDERDVPLDVVLLRLEHVVPQLVAGLQYLHRFQKVHGFVRPSNVLVTRDGACKFTDYGILPGLVYRAADESDDTVSLLQAPEHLPYVAPEIESEATPQADLYALGCVLFEAIAGVPPADVLEFVPGKRRKFETPPLAEVVPECPARWAEQVDALLRDVPAERPSLGAIAEIMGGREGRVVQLPPTYLPEPDNFVGQQETMEALRDEARMVSDESKMHLVLLEGAAGSGKSMLVDELAHWLSRRGWLVIGGHCFNRESVPYQGWHEIASRLQDVCEALPPLLQETVEEDRRLASVLFPQLSPGGAPVRYDTQLGRLAAIRALRRLLGFLAEQRPLLLCIEDLHWASWDSASLLMDLFSETADIPCLVVGTWRVDSERSDDHFLRRDLDLSLLQVRHLAVPGFTSDDAREYLVSHAPGAPIGALRKMLSLGRSNPRVLDELVWEYQHDQLDDVRDASGNQTRLLTTLYRRRMDELEERHEAVLDLLAVASGPMEEPWLRRAVEHELSGNVLPAEQTKDAIAQAIEELAALNLVRSERAGTEKRWVIAHDICRDAVADGLSARDRARLAGRIADAVGTTRPDRHDLQFEYELRASRVSKAVSNAVRAARASEARFAFHRAAKLWRWLLEHEEKIEDPTLDPGAELARTEHLAGQHARAAKLYQSWAEKTSDRTRRSRIQLDEAKAWLSAGDTDAAIAALEQAFGGQGETYVGRWHAPVSETPRRLVAALVRWNQTLAETATVGAASEEERLLAELYDFALDYRTWLISGRASEIESRLARLAEKTGDARILGLHRLRLALLHAGPGILARRDRAFEWLDEATAIFNRVDDPGCVSDAQICRAILHIRYCELAGARAALDGVIEVNRHAEDVQKADRRALLFWRAQFHLRAAELGHAERYARQLLHTYRGDHVVASRAYRTLTMVALLRGEAPLAAAFLDTGAAAMKATESNEAAALWLEPRTQLHIALGRPEVAVGQLDVEWERLVNEGRATVPEFAIPLHLSMGQAAAALADRQRVLGETRVASTLARMRDVRKRVEGHLNDMDPVRRSAALRFCARTSLALGKPRKALRYIEGAIESLGGCDANIEIARCAEAHGIVLARLERPEARGIIDQAWELYRHCGVSYPLVLEGWPVPRDAAMLKED